MNTVHWAPAFGRSQAAGLRKLTPKMLGTIDICEKHDIRSELLPGKVLAAFKAAAPYLGLRPNVVHAVDWLFRFTQSVDWQPDARPIVWPSAAMQQQDMGLGVSQVKNLNRYLVELGLVVMKDSPNRKRYGRRDTSGRIVEAYGFDLTPLASRYAEFQAAAEAGREERARVQALKRRATIARNGIRQLRETALEHSLSSAEWETFQAAASLASRGIADKGASIEAEMAVTKLEWIQNEMHQFLEAAFEARNAAQRPMPDEPVNLSPRGPKNWPHITSTNQLHNPKDTVIASREGIAPALKPQPQGREIGMVEKNHGGHPDSSPPPDPRPSRTDSGSLLKITPTQLRALAPRLNTYLTNHAPSWPEIVDAADWLREELGISKFIWGDACTAMGREQAAVAVAIVSTKSPGYFRGSAGAYFHGMVARAKSGDLHLTRTLWGIRGRGEQPQMR